MTLAATPSEPKQPTRLLLHAFSTFKLGGPQARFIQLANAFGNRYHHVVVAMDNCFDAGARLGPQVSWERRPLDVLRGGGLANRHGFRAILKSISPDLLLTYNWGAIEWAAANLPKCVSHVHVEDGFGPEEANMQLPRRVWMRRVLLGLPRVPVVVPSRNLQKIATQTWRLSAKRVHCVPNGVALAEEDVLQDHEARVGQKPLVIGTVAGLRPEKNIPRLLKAFALACKLYPARLVVVGGGPLQTELEALANTLNIDGLVEFTGYLENPIAKLRTFDLFALSSDTEQLPIAMLEAMANDVPVLATRVGDVESILAPRLPACVVEPNDAAFAKGLCDALKRQDLWPTWRAQGLALVQESYSERDMLVRWTHVFNNEINQLGST